MAKGSDDKQQLRTGFTTGACAAAAARAATLALVGGKALAAVTTILPNGAEQSFELKRCEHQRDGWLASIVKDAGDDPDCTHGAELVARVRLSEEAGVKILGGEGVAVVTKEGLGLELGQPAITPVPRTNVTEMVTSALSTLELQVPGAIVELAVPHGEEMAKQTLNERLGLVGGISILGTTGIVRPYSTAAYRASVVNAIDLAHAVGHKDVVLSTGGKTEAYAMRLLPELTQDAFIQAGDFIGTAVKSCARVRRGGIVVAMIGKLSKMADGKHMTHAAGSKVNLELLGRLARDSGADESLAKLVAGANTARHALELCLAANLTEFGFRVCEQAAQYLRTYAKHTGHRADIGTVLLGFDGAVLGCCPRDFMDSLMDCKGMTND